LHINWDIFYILKIFDIFFYFVSLTYIFWLNLHTWTIWKIRMLRWYRLIKIAVVKVAWNIWWNSYKKNVYTWIANKWYWRYRDICQGYQWQNILDLRRNHQSLYHFSKKVLWPLQIARSIYKSTVSTNFSFLLFEFIRIFIRICMYTYS